jgi:hypothetical protein
MRMRKAGWVQNTECGGEWKRQQAWRKELFEKVNSTTPESRLCEAMGLSDLRKKVGYVNAFSGVCVTGSRSKLFNPEFASGCNEVCL